MKKLAVFILFFLYAASLILVLLVVKFPKEQVLAAAGAWIERQVPGISCKIGDISYVHPLSFRLDRINVATGDGEMLGSVDDVLFAYQRQLPGVAFRVGFQLYDGTIEGLLVWHGSDKSLEVTDLNVERLDLASITPLMQLERAIDGRASFVGEFSGPARQLGDGKLRGTATIKDLKLELKRPILQSNSLVFQEMAAEITTSEGIIALTGGEATGPVYDVRFDGTVSYGGSPWPDSAVDIKGELMPHADYLRQNRQAARAVALLGRRGREGAIACALGGSLRQPLFHLGETIPWQGQGGRQTN